MSWLYSQALVEAYSGAQSSDGEPCAQLSVTPTAHPFWHRDKTMEPSRLSRYGLTCQVLTADRGGELLTSYLAGFRARTSASPEMEQASPEPAADSGDTWHGSLARYDPAMRLWKTAQPSLFEGSELSLVTFPRSGMTVGGLLWELPTLGPRTSEIGSGSWPTPTATLGTNGGKVTPNKAREGGTLIEAVSNRMWPTPTKSDGMGGPGNSGRDGGLNLRTAVKLATPTARDWRSGKASEATHAKNSRPLSEQIGGSLSPEWVEWLMNWPLGWTDLEPSAMDKYRDVWPKPGAD